MWIWKVNFLIYCSNFFFFSRKINLSNIFRHVKVQASKKYGVGLVRFVNNNLCVMHTSTKKNGIFKTIVFFYSKKMKKWFLIDDLRYLSLETAQYLSYFQHKSRLLIYCYLILKFDFYLSIFLKLIISFFEKKKQIVLLHLIFILIHIPSFLLLKTIPLDYGS